MSKFNTTSTIKTTNKSGHVAYAMGNKPKLVTQVLTSFFNEAKYYGDNSNELIQTAKAVIKADAHFVANLARYARKEMHLRSVSHALAALIAHEIESKQYIKEVVADVVERPDDITEILACYLNMYGKPIANGLKRALAAALGKFSEYQISKYNGGDKAVKFKDILKLTHAKPANAEQDKIFREIMEDTLPVAERWETELSAKGNTKEVWENLIDGNKLGYMAMLRNLRNIINAAPANIDKVYAKLANKEQVLKSKQLPFRFFAAYQEVAKLPNAGSKVLDVLETALEYSIENLPKLSGTTVIAIDTSGSMGNRISSKSEIRCVDIARLLAVMASHICENAIVYAFDTGIHKVQISSRGGIIQTAQSITNYGGGTNLSLPLTAMLEYGIKADRLLMISDNEINSGYSYTCQGLADRYRRQTNPNLWVHAVDLMGYGTQQFVGARTNIIAGWSEKVLEFIQLAEEGIDTQIKKIENFA